MGNQATKSKQRAPTLYAIIAAKLLKGLLFLGLAVGVFRLAGKDLPSYYHHLLTFLHLNPERRFWTELAAQVGNLTGAKVRWAAAGTLVYSLFSLVEAIGLMFRVTWAGWLTIGESAFFIPIEIFELLHRHGSSVVVPVILAFNVLVLWYLFQNRARLFQHARG
ncbi:Membrane protein-like protein [Verrucomicrobia bacterium]|nr:Membrane protein-like protein [Verrucomicrobiota bacterium]